MTPSTHPHGDGCPLRSANWLQPTNVVGMLHRSALKATGLSRTLVDEGRPVIGICNSWSETVHCNVHLRSAAEAVKRGILEAGGVPLEFPTISLSEVFMKPTAMLYRNLMAMDVEESIRSQPFDAVVLLASCDKTVPAQLMGAASAGVPAIMMTGGPGLPACFKGGRPGALTDVWKFTDDLRAGRITQDEYAELEAAMIPSAGHCNELGTASTMATLVEAMGMSLPGTAAIPAVDARRAAAAEDTGRRAVEIARAGLTPDKILTYGAFHNAITALMATGGSTNAIVHLLALARRLDVPVSLETFDKISRQTPVVSSLRPSGEYLFGDLFNVGGVPALLRELRPLLHLDARLVSGETMGEAIDRNPGEADGEVVVGLSKPRYPRGGIAVLHGTLAPRGAVIKLTASSPELLRHSGRAVVFDGMDDVIARIDSEDLDVDADSVLILRNVGPKGGPGFPEWGMVPIPKKLLAQGVTDMIRISDARMSGTGFGTVILHVAPESAVGGPLAAVRDGDEIVLDVEAGRLDLMVDDAEIARRLAEFDIPKPAYARGYGSLFLKHVTQADEGCDFDFLQYVPDEEAGNLPMGLLDAEIGGWYTTLGVERESK